MAHWIFGYFSVSQSNDEEINIAVPCGACGNLIAGVYAKKLGLPINLVACSGKNYAVYQCIKSGKLSRSIVKPSLANAMDIQVPYNIERILYLLANGNDQLICSLMETYSKIGRVDLPKELAENLQNTIETSITDDDGIKETLQWCKNQYQYDICPHTATAVSFAMHQSKQRPILCIATASWEKFPEVFAAAGLEPPPLTERQKLMEESRPCHAQFLSRDSMETWTQEIRSVIDQIYEERK